MTASGCRHRAIGANWPLPTRMAFGFTDPKENAVQAAYDREEMLEARRPVMERWAAFLSGADASNVVPLKRA